MSHISFMSRGMHVTTGGSNAQDLQKQPTSTVRVVDIAVVPFVGFRVCAATRANLLVKNQW